MIILNCLCFGKGGGDYMSACYFKIGTTPPDKGSHLKYSEEKYCMYCDSTFFSSGFKNCIFDHFKIIPGQWMDSVFTEMQHIVT